MNNQTNTVEIEMLKRYSDAWNEHNIKKIDLVEFDPKIELFQEKLDLIATDMVEKFKMYYVP